VNEPMTIGREPEPRLGGLPRLRATDTAPLPNFVVIGAMKSGTTSLFHYLRSHPQVFMSPLKELDFFNAELNWDRGLDWYRRQFTGAGPEVVAIGEASTLYSRYPEYAGVPDRIAATLPGVRLIYVVRDPIERIRSHYQHRSLIGAEREPMATAVTNDPRYVDCSRYAFQIRQYLRVFPREQLLVVTSERLRSDRQRTIQEIYRFLGVDEHFVPDTLNREFYRTDERGGYPPFAWWLRRTVKRRFPAAKRAKELIDHVRPSSIGRVRTEATAATRDPAVTVSDDVRAVLAERLRDDVRELYPYMPEGFDGWRIA
jgi:sulfotransferase family protein